MKKLLFVMLASVAISGCSSVYKSSGHEHNHEECACSKDKKSSGACACKEHKDGAEHECKDCKK